MFWSATTILVLAIVEYGLERPETPRVKLPRNADDGERFSLDTFYPNREPFARSQVYAQRPYCRADLRFGVATDVKGNVMDLYIGKRDYTTDTHHYYATRYDGSTVAVVSDGRDCSSEDGCFEIGDGDGITIDGVEHSVTVTN